jgi:hypothetical protein
MMAGETSNNSSANAARIAAIREGSKSTAIGFATRQSGGDMVEVGRFKSTKQFNITGDVELEGANYITTLTKTAPTANRTITFPDATGTVALLGTSQSGNLTITGELDAATLDISGDADIDGTLEADAITINGTAIGDIYGVKAGSSSIVTTGALDSGSITSGFGNIDVGSSNLTATGTVSLGATSFNDNNITNVGNIALDSLTADGSSITITGNTTFADGAFDFDIASHDTSNGLKLGGTLVTATAAELNHCDGVTSNIQTQLNSAATTGKAIAMAMVFG